MILLQLGALEGPMVIIATHVLSIIPTLLWRSSIVRTSRQLQRVNQQDLHLLGFNSLSFRKKMNGRRDVPQVLSRGRLGGNSFCLKFPQISLYFSAKYHCLAGLCPIYILYLLSTVLTISAIKTLTPSMGW